MSAKVKIVVRRPSRSNYARLYDDEQLEVNNVQIQLSRDYVLGELVLETKDGTYDVLPSGRIMKREAAIWRLVRTRTSSF